MNIREKGRGGIRMLQPGLRCLTVGRFDGRKTMVKKGIRDG
jgi:hypothetical protein